MDRVMLMYPVRVYYAHCKAIYYSPQEVRDIKTLQSLGFEVINPSDGIWDKPWKEKGMEFKYEIVGMAQALAFRALPDGSIPAGVYAEIMVAKDMDMPIFELPSSILRRGIDLEQTREYLREVGER
jgi:hypothetical protein